VRIGDRREKEPHTPPGGGPADTLREKMFGKEGLGRGKLLSVKLPASGGKSSRGDGYRSKEMTRGGSPGKRGVARGPTFNREKKRTCFYKTGVEGIKERRGGKEKKNENSTAIRTVVGPAPNTDGGVGGGGDGRALRRGEERKKTKRTP